MLGRDKADLVGTTSIKVSKEFSKSAIDGFKNDGAKVPFIGGMVAAWADTPSATYKKTFSLSRACLMDKIVTTLVDPEWFESSFGV